MAEIGIPELLIVCAIVVIVLGPGRLAGLGRALGDGLRALRQGLSSARPSAADERAAEERAREHL